MNILNIQPVVRGESKVLLAFAGPSGTGKTLSALYVARGMVSHPSEIGFLDTENGRGSFYSDKLDDQFLYANLNPPFSPKRYGQAIKEFQAAGAKVLVIDSVSHEWEGIGGCEDIANSPKADGSARKIADWVTSKSEHRTKFMAALMYSDMHIICCVRAREKTDFKDITKPVSLGIQPVCEKNFMFEMMASVMFSNEGKNQSWIKVPDYLKPAFGDGKNYLGSKTGREIMDWVRKGEKEDPLVTKSRGELILIAENGIVALREAFALLPKNIQFALKKELHTFEAAAIAFDESRAIGENNQPVNEETARIKEAINKIDKNTTPIDLSAIESICEVNEELANLFTEKRKSLGI